MSSQYPKDEFDVPDEDAPVGVHRQPASRWRPVLPFLVVLVVVPLLAWIFSAFLTRDAGSGSGSGEEEVVAMAPQSEEPMSEDPWMAEPESADILEPLPEEAEVLEETPDETDPGIDYATAIEVANASGIVGLAGQTGAVLENAGFTNVRADNRVMDLAQNTVYYRSAEYEATANEVAQTLGIDAVLVDAAVAEPDPIVVVLVAQ